MKFAILAGALLSPALALDLRAAPRSFPHTSSTYIPQQVQPSPTTRPPPPPKPTYTGIEIGGRAGGDAAGLDLALPPPHGHPPMSTRTTTHDLPPKYDNTPVPQKRDRPTSPFGLFPDAGNIHDLPNIGDIDPPVHSTVPTPKDVAAEEEKEQEEAEKEADKEDGNDQQKRASPDLGKRLNEELSWSRDYYLLCRDPKNGHHPYSSNAWRLITGRLYCRQYTGSVVRRQTVTSRAAAGPTNPLAAAVQGVKGLIQFLVQIVR